LPDVTSDARQRRLTYLINTASLARTTPALYVIEDAHWIDEVSEAMIAEFASVIPQAHAMVLVTYRPEYRGALTRPPNAHKLALVPLDGGEASALTTELVGSHPSVTAVAAQIAERAAGNPFFVQEIVRDLAERGVLDGNRGAYVCHRDIGDVGVPATVQAAIAARIDRLDAAAKRTLNAASVIGLRCSEDLLTCVLGEADAGGAHGAALSGLVGAELLDQVMFTPRAEYAFHHPLTRTVAYESQLKSNRADLHRRLAAAIQQRDPSSADENAALIAEHLQAAGDLHEAFSWHMRAGAWSTYRDIAATKTSWQRAREVADRLPADDPNQLAMRIAPRTLRCGNAWRIGGNVADTGFDELRELTSAAGDKLSLVIGMAGQLTALSFNDRIAESAQLATECAALIESIGDPAMTVGLMPGPLQAKLQAGEVVETLRLAHLVIDLANGDATMGNLLAGSPLSFGLMYRGCAEMYLGRPGFKDHLDQAIAIARPVDPTCFAVVVLWTYVNITTGALLLDDSALRDSEDALTIAEQSGDDFALACALVARGVVLVNRDGPDGDVGYELLAEAREMALAHRFTRSIVPLVDSHFALRKAQTADVDGAIDLARSAVINMSASGDRAWPGFATTALVEALLRRETDGDVAEAQAAIDRLAAIPTDPGFVMYELPLLRLRALIARAHGDEITYLQRVQRYRTRATACRFRGHMAIAEAMA
jgi:hypothetical protein